MLLSDQQFEWFYDIAFPKEVHLANISGGTDIVSLLLFNVAETVN
jgi:acetoacetyl-CoA synthetase